MKIKIAKYILPVIVFPVFCISINAQSNDQNYIRIRTMMDESDSTKYLETIQYYDGLGRSVETIQRGFTPNKADLISYQEYDNVGRDSTVWLPAIASGNNGAFLSLAEFKVKSTNTYNNTTYNSATDLKPYSRPVYEPSPLNRINEQFGPGADWHNNGKSLKTNYLTNSSAYPCAYYYISGDNNTLVRNNNYPDNQLYVTKNTDEEGNISYEFKDKLGYIVLKRQINNNNNYDTYYVYDDFGNLRYVLPPLAADGTGNGNYTENSTVIKNYAYVYRYNNHNLCKWKQLPGCSPVYYVYDRADRLIFTQDGEQRSKDECLFIISDELGRVVLTGLSKNSLNPDIILSDVVKATHPENSYPNNEMKGYTVSGITLTTPVVLTSNYYDDYNFRGTNGIPTYDTDYDPNAGIDFNKRYTVSYKGLLTGTLTAVLNGSSISSSYLYSIMYYDYKGQLIQSVSNNTIGSTEKKYIAYDFNGHILKKKLFISYSGGITDNYRYVYDHAGRLTHTYYKHTFDPEYLMTYNTYDELGRLKTTTPFDLQNFKSTYAYNIRSWISKIGSSPYTEDLTYMYNGNIATMQWLQGGITRKYTFFYDNLSRLTSANYNNPGSELFYAHYEYDKHGNITSLSRKGLKAAGSYGDIDIVSLEYGGSNQLKYAYDNGETVTLSTSYDFKNYSSAAIDYTYNANGSMTKDLNKGISNITYNTLNLPSMIDIKSPVAEARNEYVYAADGRKLKVLRHWASVYSTNPIIGSDITYQNLNNYLTIEYCDNNIFEYGSLKRTLTENGYYEDGNYYFYLKNHLSSNVVVAKKDGSIVQNNHYYPDGLMMGISDNQGIQAYKYTGKELDMQHGLMQYDFEARQYDPTVRRFITMDPLAEKYPHISPYAFCSNNPVNRIDPTGTEDYYFTNGTYLGRLGDNDDIRVINATMSEEDARTHFNSGSDDAISALMGGSVAFADYFTTVNDVTNGAKVVPYSGNCYDAAAEQMNNAGYAPEGSRAQSTIFTKVGEGTDNPNNLTENTVGGAIKIMTDLNKGKPVMVGVEQTNAVGNFNRQDANTNPLTSHFVVVNSSTVNGGAVSFNYLDNAGGKGPLNLNISNGAISGGITNRGAVKNYTISEVRNSWKIRR
jgi:RHS repeat-associated protein